MKHESQRIGKQARITRETPRAVIAVMSLYQYFLRLWRSVGESFLMKPSSRALAGSEIRSGSWARA